MRVETGLARPAVSKRAAPIALVCALALTGFACPADTAVTGASAGHAPSASIVAAAEAAATDAPIARAPRDGAGAGAGGSAAAVAFEEQSLPPEDSGISGGISGSVTRAARRLAEPGRRG